jgi:dTDP-4-amino-4,6-dideoxygalactose transaminase
VALALLGGTPLRTRPFPLWPAYDQEEEQALLKVLHSRAWGGYHECVKELEADFARYHDVPYAVACSNGTVALEVALRAVGIGPGDEVIVSPHTFIASASAILLCRASPVFADIDPDSSNLSVKAAEQAITSRTRAIVVVHFGGRPAEMDSFQRLAVRHGLALVEDAAHAHGARYRGIPVGGWGDVATFSFQSFKLMTAGEGGMIVSRSADIIEKCWSYCNQGRRRDGGWFDHYTLGSNYRISAFQAAVLGAQFRKLPQQSQLRALNVAYFRERLRTVDGLSLAEDDPRVQRNPYYLLTMRYRPEAFSGLPRDLMLSALQAEGVPFKPTYPHPLYRNPLFANESGIMSRFPGWHCPQDYTQLSLPEAERVCRDGVWLSHTAFLGDKHDVDDVIEAVKKVQSLASSLLDSKATTTPVAAQRR